MAQMISSGSEAQTLIAEPGHPLNDAYSRTELPEQIAVINKLFEEGCGPFTSTDELNKLQ